MSTNIEEKVKKLWYEEGGNLEKLRNGDYNIPESEKELIKDFAREVNNALKRNEIETKSIAMILDLIRTLPWYSDEEWVVELADATYDIVMDSVNFLVEE